MAEELDARDRDVLCGRADLASTPKRLGRPDLGAEKRRDQPTPQQFGDGFLPLASCGAQGAVLSPHPASHSGTASVQSQV